MPPTELRGFARGVLCRSIGAEVIVGEVVNVAVGVIIKVGVR